MQLAYCDKTINCLYYNGLPVDKAYYNDNLVFCGNTTPQVVLTYNFISGICGLCTAGYRNTYCRSSYINCICFSLCNLSNKDICYNLCIVTHSGGHLSVVHARCNYTCSNIKWGGTAIYECSGKCVGITNCLAKNRYHAFTVESVSDLTKCSNTSCIVCSFSCFVNSNISSIFTAKACCRICDTYDSSVANIYIGLDCITLFLKACFTDNVTCVFTNSYTIAEQCCSFNGCLALSDYVNAVNGCFTGYTNYQSISFF